MQCHPVSGSCSRKVHLVANTKLRLKPDRILLLQVPSVYLPKPRKWPTNMYLKLLPIPTIITQFAFFLRQGSMSLIARVYFPLYICIASIRLARKNSKRENNYKEYVIFLRSQYEIFLKRNVTLILVTLISKVKSDFLCSFQQISSERYYDILR